VRDGSDRVWRHATKLASVMRAVYSGIVHVGAKLLGHEIGAVGAGPLRRENLETSRALNVEKGGNF